MSAPEMPREIAKEHAAELAAKYAIGSLIFEAEKAIEAAIIAAEARGAERERTAILAIAEREATEGFMSAARIRDAIKARTP